jgi:hypothetical protein
LVVISEIAAVEADLCVFVYFYGVEVDDDSENVEIERRVEYSVGVIYFSCKDGANVVTHAFFFVLPLCFHVDAFPNVIPLILFLFVSLGPIFLVVEWQNERFAAVEVDGQFIFLLEPILLLIVYHIEDLVCELDVDVENGDNLSRRFL